MTSTSLQAIVHNGREYRFLLQAELAMRNRLRALCSALHHSLADDNGAGEETGEGHKAPKTVIHFAIEKLHARWGEVPVPQWLAKPPPGIHKARWHPEILLGMSWTAQTLLHYSLELHADLIQQRKPLEQAVRSLPIWEDWCAHIRGVDAYGLGRILCETDDLWHYPTVAKVWKRLGVGLWNGERQRAIPNISQEEAMAIGYSKRRRAVVYNLQVGLLTQNKDADGTPGIYKACYLDRKVVEQAKVPDGTKLLWHRRASRYMAKRFLRDLWVAWRDYMPKPLEPVHHE